MNCERARRLLGVYRDLDRPERRALTQHLRGCEACRVQWGEEQRVKRMVRAVPVLEVPRTLESRLLAIPATTARPRLARPVPWLALAGAALLVGGLGLLSSPDASPTAPGAAEAGAASHVGRPGSAATPVARRAAAVVRPAGLDGPLPADEGLTSGPAEPVVVAASRPVRRAFVDAGAPPVLGQAPATAPAPGDRGTGSEAQGQGGGDGGSHDKDHKPPAATAIPTACVDLTVLAFADLAGDGGRDCAGCDGLWTPDDAARAAELGIVLPPLTFSLSDPKDPDRRRPIETVMPPTGARITWHTQDCGPFPFVVELRDGPGEWSLCPLSDEASRTVTGPGQKTVNFPFTTGCPLPTATTAPAATTAPPASETPGPVEPSPTAAPDPSGVPPGPETPAP